MQEIKVFGVWGSPFSRRVEIALKMKGLDYEFIEEDLDNKSDHLLMYNPVHKKIPVLVHNGKPVVESSLIMEYIDETWKENGLPLLPTDPYERAQVRFWAKFIDDKMVASVRAALLRRGEDSEKAKEEMEEILKVVESEITKRDLFGGEKLSFLDIIGLFIAYWIPIIQDVGGNYVLTREKFPGIYEWADQLLDDAFIKENLPDKAKLLLMLQARFGVKV
ncbi:putative glutathione S-transferase [Silene latifolia]|uniref:putative glutathione S-transferase n=1 Tax=Silene latifolia TaxID=37657 RepID=UPI003D78835F